MVVVVGGARQQSDGKSRKRAILLFQVSLCISKKTKWKIKLLLQYKSKADTYAIELDPWAESKPVFWSRTEAIM